jgi:hypothetical protein
VDDQRLFNSKGLDNMIELNSNNNVDLKTICTSFRIKLGDLHFGGKIDSKTNKKIIFHVFDPNYNARYYYICEWSKK